MSGVSGPGFGALAELRQQLQSMADGSFIRKVRSALGREALHQVDEGFAQKRAPDGTPWAPSNGFGETMEDKNTLHTSFSTQETSDGFQVCSSAKYAAQRQYGGTIKAKNGKYLKFKVPFSFRIASNRGGNYRRVDLGLKGYSSNWVQVPFVNQPARPMVPEGQLGPIWGAAFDEESRRVMHEHLGRS